MCQRAFGLRWELLSHQVNTPRSPGAAPSARPAAVPGQVIAMAEIVRLPADATPHPDRLAAEARRVVGCAEGEAVSTLDPLRSPWRPQMGRLRRHRPGPGGGVM